MAKNNNKLTKRQRLQNFTKNTPRTEYKGIEFLFDDEQLQEEYITERNKFKTLEINFIEPVGYNDAKSLINGKMNERLKKIQEKYNKNDNNYSAGLLHKNQLFDKVRDEYENQTPNDQLDKLNKLFDLVEKETKKWNDNHEKNNGQQKYNIVYYTQSGKGKHSPI